MHINRGTLESKPKLYHEDVSTDEKQACACPRLTTFLHILWLTHKPKHGINHILNIPTYVTHSISLLSMMARAVMQLTYYRHHWDSSWFFSVCRGEQRLRIFR